MSAIFKAFSSAVLVGVFSVLMTARASEAGRRELPSVRTWRLTRIGLEAAGDADSLAAAAELGRWPTGRAARQLALLTRAVALAPNRPDLVWLQLNVCAQIRTCELEPIATRLQALNPENGASWLPSLNRAVRVGDTEAAGRYLRAIAQGRRFDLYWNMSVGHIASALIKVHTLDAATALTAVFGAESAHALPAFQNISKACRPPASADSARIITCRRIAAAMRNGDTYIAEMLGIAIAERVWPATGTEYAEALAERRLGQYRMRTAAGITAATLHGKAAVIGYLGLLRTHRTEQGAALALITSAGADPVPPVPPAPPPASAPRTPLSRPAG